MNNIKNIIYTSILVLSLMSNSIAKEKELPNFKLGVNKFAWYASLQTINFMPLISADPFSGIILTDWYGINNTEQYKIDVYILEELLTSNTISVKVFKRIKNNNQWDYVQMPNSFSKKIEDAILNLSRKLRTEQVLSGNS